MRTRDKIRHLVAILAIFIPTVPLLFPQTQIGDRVAGYRLADSGGRMHTLDEYAGRIVVLEFWSFKCPVALTYNERMKALQARYEGRGVVLLAVDSNRNESALEVRRNVENLKLPFPVLLDPDGTLADRVRATLTPSAVILDGTGTLRYRGAIDNARAEGDPGRIAFVEEALDALLAGKPVPRAETPVSGCAIRR